MAKFNTGQSFADGDTVTGAKLNNITSQLNIYTGVISEQTAIVATVSTADQLLIADTDNGDSGAANRVTVQKLLNDTLTNGTYTNAQLSGNLNVVQLSTLGTINSTRGTVGILNSTTGTIATLNSTTGTIPTLTAGTTTSTAANITNGTVQTLTASTANITVGTYSGLINSSTGTFSGSINSTAGTIATLNSTTGTIATLKSTTGTISNLSTTLAGDFTISQGTGTLGTTGITAGTYGTNTQAVSLTVDAKGRITTISTSAIATITSGSAVASTSGTAIDFTGIPSYVKQIFVMFSKVSVDGTSSLLLQLGDSGGIENTNYDGMSGLTATSGANANINITNGIPLIYSTMSAASEYSGNLRILNIDQNKWTIDGIIYASSLNYINYFAGTKETSGTLDRIRITTSGTNTFDLGLINIMYQ